MDLIITVTKLIPSEEVAYIVKKTCKIQYTMNSTTGKKYTYAQSTIVMNLYVSTLGVRVLIILGGVAQWLPSTFLIQ